MSEEWFCKLKHREEGFLVLAHCVFLDFGGCGVDHCPQAAGFWRVDPELVQCGEHPGLGQSRVQCTEVSGIYQNHACGAQSQFGQDNLRLAGSWIA